MNNPLVCLLLAALPAFGNDQPAEAPVVLYQKLEHAMAEPVMRALRSELAEIMKPLGYDFQWRSLDVTSAQEVVSELAVITFRGRCEVFGLGNRSVVPPALGWTHMSDGVILPFSEVDCDRVREFLQRELMRERAPVRDELFGKALARVLAHELYHVFAHTAHHVSCGVAKSSYSVSDLLSDEFEFEKLEPDLFRKIAARHELTP
jgi:hypothetical protein